MLEENIRCSGPVLISFFRNFRIENKVISKFLLNKKKIGHTIWDPFLIKIFSLRHRGVKSF